MPCRVTIPMKGSPFGPDDRVGPKVENLLAEGRDIKGSTRVLPRTPMMIAHLAGGVVWRLSVAPCMHSRSCEVEHIHHLIMSPTS